MTQDEWIVQKSLLKVFEKDPDNPDVVHTKKPQERFPHLAKAILDVEQAFGLRAP